MDLLQKTRDLAAVLDTFRHPAGVSHVYNPLSYMATAHEAWLSRYVQYGECDEVAVTPSPYLILGMNPGPWGMVQTGVPFGDVPNAGKLIGVRDGSTPFTAQIPCGVSLPAIFKPQLDGIQLHPKRPVQGFACTRVEASGDRLWGGLATVWGLLDAVLDDCFAMNYCPLAYFSGEAGENVTPEAFIKAGPYRDEAYAQELDDVCGAYLRTVMRAMDTKVVLAIGRYAERKAKIAASMVANKPAVVYLTHPSPLATRNAEQWAEMARTTMQAAGVLP